MTEGTFFHPSTQCADSKNDRVFAIGYIVPSSNPSRESSYCHQRKSISYSWCGKTLLLQSLSLSLSLSLSFSLSLSLSLSLSHALNISHTLTHPLTSLDSEVSSRKNAFARRRLVHCGDGQQGKNGFLKHVLLSVQIAVRFRIRFPSQSG
jgi:hypothetical protein